MGETPLPVPRAPNWKWNSRTRARVCFATSTLLSDDACFKGRPALPQGLWQFGCKEKLERCLTAPPTNASSSAHQALLRISCKARKREAAQTLASRHWRERRPNSLLGAPWLWISRCSLQEEQVQLSSQAQRRPVASKLCLETLAPPRVSAIAIHTRKLSAGRREMRFMRNTSWKFRSIVLTSRMPQRVHTSACNHGAFCTSTTRNAAFANPSKSGWPSASRSATLPRMRPQPSARTQCLVSLRKLRRFRHYRSRTTPEP